jgi:predicted ester cyclase
MSLVAREALAEVVRRFHEEYFNRGTLEGVEALCTPDVVLHHGGSTSDLAGAVQLASAFLAGFPDGRNTIEDVVLADDRVVTRGVFRGTHRGAFFGIPPTGRPVAMTWIGVDRFEGDRIAERWVEQDTLGLLRQIGAAPAPAG